LLRCSGVGPDFPVAVHVGVPVQHGRQGRRRGLVQPTVASKVQGDRAVHGLSVGAGGVRGHRHGDVRHAGRLDVSGQHVLLRDQPVQDRHRELRAGGQRHARGGRPSDETGHQVRVPVAGHGNHSHVL